MSDPGVKLWDAKGMHSTFVLLVLNQISPVSCDLGMGLHFSQRNHLHSDSKKSYPFSFKPRQAKIHAPVPNGENELINFKDFRLANPWLILEMARFAVQVIIIKYTKKSSSNRNANGSTANLQNCHGLYAYNRKGAQSQVSHVHHTDVWIHRSEEQQAKS